MTETLAQADTAAAVLDFARDRRGTADRAEADLLQAAVTWAAMHSVDSITDAATIWDRRYGDTGITVAGPGAPLVAEFSVAEFAAAIGLPTETGKAYLGEAVELRYRLPRVWARVVAGDLAAWRARRIARATLLLTLEAAGFVDTHLAHLAHKIRLAQLDRLIEEAITRYMPEEAERRRRDAAEGRGFTIDKGNVSLDGTADVWGTLDLADALDLDTAVTTAAQALKDLGSTDTLPVRRAIALGQIARQQLTLDLNTDPETRAGADEATRRGSRQARSTGGHHPDTQAAAGGALPAPRRRRGPARSVRDRPPRAPREHPVPGHRRADPPLVRQPRHPGSDQAGHRPQRPRPRRRLRGPRPDGRGRHPHRPHLRLPLVHPPRQSQCTPTSTTRTATTSTSYDTGGPTCSCNIAPLCRRHHRLKTHSTWTYTPLERGTYLWTSPHGYQYLRNHHGTLDVSRDRPPRP